jgi:hypothetical protein
MEPIKTFGMAVMAMLGTAGGDLIQNHTVDLQTVCAVGMIVLGGTWSLSRRFTRLEDRLETVESEIKALPCPGKQANCEEQKKP